jgi:ketosteroid isomerase-like protein
MSVTQDMARAQAELMRVDAEWAAITAEARDVERIVSFWADDAVVIPPGSPTVTGKEAIRNYVTSSLRVPSFHIHWKTDSFKVSRDCDLAYGIGTNRVSFNNEKGKLITSRGKVVTVWRTDAEGKWKCVVDIWNEDASP